MTTGKPPNPTMSLGASVIVAVAGYHCIASGIQALRHSRARNVVVAIPTRNANGNGMMHCGSGTMTSEIAKLNAEHRKAWNAGEYQRCTDIIARLRLLGVGWPAPYDVRSADDLDLREEAEAQGVSVDELLSITRQSGGLP
jgi:hypothetical protein